MNDRATQTTIQITGLLGGIKARELRLVSDQLASEKRKEIILDLSTLEMLDEDYAGVLLYLFNRVSDYGGQVRIVGLSGQPLRTFKILRFDQIFALN